MTDYRRCTTIGQYRDAVAREGSHFGISCARPLSRLMEQNHLSFPDAFEEAFRSGMLIATDKKLTALLRQRNVIP